MKSRIFLVTTILLLGGLIGWRLISKNQDKADQDKAALARKSAPASVDVVEAVRRDITHKYEGIGTVEAPFNVKISSKVTGLIQSLSLREGDKVSAGQVVATIDPSSVLAQVRQQEAAVAEAQARLAQADLTTNSTNVGISSLIRQQEASVSSAKALLDQVQANTKSQIAAANLVVNDAKAKVDSTDSVINNAKASFVSAKASLANAQARFNRSNALFQKGFVSAQDVDDTRTQVALQESLVQVAQGQIDGAESSKRSALAQKDGAQKQADIVRTKAPADIAAARATLNQSRAALDTAKSNTSQTAAYQANLSALKSAVEVSKAQLRNAQALLSDTSLRSSVNGYVTTRYLDAGTVVTAGTPILAIQSVHQVYVTTSIPEEISSKIRKGQTAQVEFDAIPGRTFTGIIKEINPAADLQNRQFTLRVTLENPLNQFKPGMYGRVTLVTESFPGVLVVPREAIKSDKVGSYVTVVNPDSSASRRSIKTGPEDTLGISVTEGLQPGEKVITLSQRPVKDGQKVRLGGAK